MSAEVVAHLHPPRLPEAFTQGSFADYLLAFGIGLALAALLLGLLGPALHRRAPRPSRAQALAQARALPPGDAMLALAALAQRRGIPLTDEERAALYSETPGPAAEALARRLQRRRG